MIRSPAQKCQGSALQQRAAHPPSNPQARACLRTVPLPQRRGRRIVCRSGAEAAGSSAEAEQGSPEQQASSVAETISLLDAFLGVETEKQQAALEAAAVAAAATAVAAEAPPTPAHWASLPPEEQARRHILARRREALAVRQQELEKETLAQERRVEHHRDRLRGLQRQRQELVQQQHELWSSMEPEAFAAWRAEVEEQRAAAEEATRREVLQLGAATGVLFSIGVGYQVHLAVEATDEMRKQRGRPPLGEVLRERLQQRLLLLGDPEEGLL